MSIIIGIMMMVIGGLVTVKSEWMLNAFGRIAFFEKYLGTEGGSRLGYKLVGVLIFFLGLLVTTDMIGGFMGWVLSPLINAGRI